MPITFLRLRKHLLFNLTDILAFHNSILFSLMLLRHTISMHPIVQHNPLVIELFFSVVSSSFWKSHAEKQAPHFSKLIGLDFQLYKLRPLSFVVYAFYRVWRAEQRESLVSSDLAHRANVAQLWKQTILIPNNFVIIGHRLYRALWSDFD